MRALQVLMVLSCVLSEAQVTTRTILGTVRDGAQAPAAEAVTVTKTSDTGGCQALLLIPGRYSVIIEEDGFKNVQSNIAFEVDQEARMDFTLELGGASVTERRTVSLPSAGGGK